MSDISSLSINLYWSKFQVKSEQSVQHKTELSYWKKSQDVLVKLKAMVLNKASKQFPSFLLLIVQVTKLYFASIWLFWNIQFCYREMHGALYSIYFGLYINN